MAHDVHGGGRLHSSTLDWICRPQQSFTIGADYALLLLCPLSEGKTRMHSPPPAPVSTPALYDFLGSYPTVSRDVRVSWFLT